MFYDVFMKKFEKDNLYILHWYRWSHCPKFGCKDKAFNSNEQELGKGNDVTTAWQFTIKKILKNTLKKILERYRYEIFRNNKIV